MKKPRSENAIDYDSLSVSKECAGALESAATWTCCA